MSKFRHFANRIASMLGVGRITAMKDDGGTQSVQYQTPLKLPAPTGSQSLVFPPVFLPVLTLYSHSWVAIALIQWSLQPTIRDTGTQD